MCRGPLYAGQTVQSSGGRLARPREQTASSSQGHRCQHDDGKSSLGLQGSPTGKAPTGVTPSNWPPALSFCCSGASATEDKGQRTAKMPLPRPDWHPRAFEIKWAGGGRDRCPHQKGHTEMSRLPHWLLCAGEGGGSQLGICRSRKYLDPKASGEGKEEERNKRKQKTFSTH